MNIFLALGYLLTALILIVILMIAYVIAGAFIKRLFSDKDKDTKFSLGVISFTIRGNNTKAGKWWD